MIPVLLLTLGCLILVCQLVNALSIYREKSQQLVLIKDKNYELINLYKGLGQSMMALNIQLQAAQKLWTVKPIEAQESLTEAYQLSGELMREVRQIVRSMDTVNTVVCLESNPSQNLPSCWSYFIQPTYEKSDILPNIRLLVSEKRQITHDQ
ncbi:MULTISPECIES: histidine kinase dimerization/phosphoacceptor domain-containing protein [unclassified Tolypothrix]|uniref:histidine kinase dimerization/phosphoacceptor domain-containing protein n=1 Tax=unclassified Tolypothrix TaxID=2649714 RepID=UPI0005EAA4AF|nr:MULTISPECIES: histidine kinase dimerization/phosphoacceptor domain-containing protein [unclassified Tolypothrix]BAY91011.1 response regulator receiver sensor signal transduction histidine kinase [Microchaete diplosiphon NIES-3275]EKE99731.1 sensor histidine kinase [Tolypothrix sp. PCC 7601]MBE9087732.1 histidine kinase dimerization/phosphoacceptor domain-containing protein [Tolypothrix sp. LEGE 11397]UYD25116.1 histidine kinase dimerization/phosphoacceptor domain-containing protein [Tolypoth